MVYVYVILEFQSISKSKNLGCFPQNEPWWHIATGINMQNF